ncbi:hypothetical protein H4219_003065 [Mycoemilia scoparia]|uniref:Uncharacterized protein n=1 Tax=Mycoemilia scoparia TaxID=417184 RepID=A0A9W8A2D9_9FUNG|nr:hypothetical protein H4219_003065 [Mycoemilia scoparia]
MSSYPSDGAQFYYHQPHFSRQAEDHACPEHYNGQQTQSHYPQVFIAKPYTDATPHHSAYHYEIPGGNTAYPTESVLVSRDIPTYYNAPNLGPEYQQQQPHITYHHQGPYNTNHYYSNNNGYPTQHYLQHMPYLPSHVQYQYPYNYDSQNSSTTFGDGIASAETTNNYRDTNEAQEPNSNDNGLELAKERDSDKPPSLESFGVKPSVKKPLVDMQGATTGGGAQKKPEKKNSPWPAVVDLIAAIFSSEAMMKAIDHRDASKEKDTASGGSSGIGGAGLKAKSVAMSIVKRLLFVTCMRFVINKIFNRRHTNRSSLTDYDGGGDDDSDGMFGGFSRILRSVLGESSSFNPLERGIKNKNEPDNNAGSRDVSSHNEYDSDAEEDSPSDTGRNIIQKLGSKINALTSGYGNSVIKPNAIIAVVIAIAAIIILKKVVSKAKQKRLTYR